MQGDKRIDKLMLPVLNAINRHVKDIDAKTDIYNRAYEAVMISMVVKTSTTGVKTPESIENPWIPVSERLPEEDDPACLFRTSGGGVYFGYRIGVIPCWVAVGIRDFIGPLYDTVTHWMPLPQPPSEEEC